MRVRSLLLLLTAALFGVVFAVDYGSRPRRRTVDTSDRRAPSSFDFGSSRASVDSDPAAEAHRSQSRSIKGAVTVDGERPPAGLVLRLRSDTHEAAPIDVALYEDGSFAVDDLPVDFAGVLTWPPAFEGAPPTPARALDVSVGDRPLHVSLRTAPAIVGRVYEADGRTPAEGGSVRVRIVWAMSSQEFSAPIEADGRFAHGLAKCPSSGAAPASVELRFFDAEGVLRAFRGIDGPFDVSIDLGVVVLPARPVRRAFRIVDPAGRPLADAAATGSGGLILRADATGTVVIEDEAARTAWFGAAGYTRKPAPPDATLIDRDAVAIVILDVGAALEIDVRGGAFVRATSAGLFAAYPVDALFRETAVGELVSGAVIPSDGGRTSGVALFVPDALGRVVVPELVVGADVVLELLGPKAGAEGSEAPVLATKRVVAAAGRTRVSLDDGK